MVKSIKMFMVAAAMALIAVAAIGAGSASATLLCKENVTTCAEKDIYPSGTSISATLTSNFEIPILGAKCTGSTLSGKTGAEKGSPLSAEITSLTFSGCTSCPFGLSTKFEAQNLPYSASLAKTTEDDGMLTLGNGGSGTPKLKVTCGPVNCVYSLDGFPPAFNGGNPATLVVGSAKMKTLEDSSGIGMCGSDPTPKATYEVTSPKPAHVSLAAGASNTVFCKQSGVACPVGSLYPKETAFAGSATGVKLDGSTRCDLGVSFKNTAQSGSPLPLSVSSMSFSNCELYFSSCGSPVAGTPPFSWTMAATSGGNGTAKAFNLVLVRTCAGEECRYKAPEAQGTFTGGSTPSIVFKNIPFKTEVGGQFCGGASWTIEELKYNITSPTPVYLTKLEA